jgi:hypothetical protein
MSAIKTQSGRCEEKICYEGNLCPFCLQYGRKKVFSDKEEKEIDNFIDNNRELMDDLAKGD